MRALFQLKKLIILVCFLAACSSPPTPTPSPTQIPTAEITSTPIAEPTLQLGNWHDMIFHEQLGRVVLINGGPETGKNLEDPIELWAWDGTEWSLLIADENGPRWRNFASVTYDSNRDVLILYAGVTVEKEYQDTWEWNGQTWNQFPVEGPGLREGAGMAYDAKREKVILFGGSQSGDMMNDLWEWDGSQWSQISTEGPSPRFPAGFVYDSAREYVLLFGGHSFENQTFKTFGDTWTWDGITWTQIEIQGPSPRDGARAVFDPLLNNIFLFGGAEITNNVKNLNDTWIWNGNQWSQLDVQAPPARVHPILAFDSNRGVIVMTGGSNGPGATLSDTWEWDGTSWICKMECE